MAVTVLLQLQLHARFAEDVVLIIINLDIIHIHRFRRDIQMYLMERTLPKHRVMEQRKKQNGRRQAPMFYILRHRS